jgi:glycosyltransferase involved in cell wall biosynthesis
VKIAFSMIVKNESGIILRCLEAMRPWVEKGVIHDTGSTDDTVQITRDYARLNGWHKLAVRETLWKNFAHNRNAALADASTLRADYVLCMDADDQLVVTDPKWRDQLGRADVFNVELHLQELRYHRPLLFRPHRGCIFKGPVHEYLDVPAGLTVANLEGVHVLASASGARSRNPNKFLDDAKMLHAQLECNPTDPRSQFYLAQSYRDTGAYKDEAKAWYKIRADNPDGWQDERFYSMLEYAKLNGNLTDYLRAYQFQPHRAEPLYYAARGKLHDPVAFMLIRQAYEIPRPPMNCIFVDAPVYDYLIAVDYAVACIYAGRKPEAIRINEGLLERTDLPENVRKLVETNLGFAKR